jgi:RHS repeat-associated protein
MITDSSGVVKGAMDNLPFGEDAGVIGESEKHRFTTYERESSNEGGTDYAVNRQYSQVTGRFNRPDPIQADVANPQSLNRYPYVGNAPLDFTDPLGLVGRVIELVGCQPLIGPEGFPVKFFDTIVQVCTFRIVHTGLKLDDGGKGGGKGLGKKPLKRKTEGKPPECTDFDTCPQIESKIAKLFVSLGIRELEQFLLGDEIGHDIRINIERENLKECLRKFAEKVIKGECGLTPGGKLNYDRAARRVGGRFPRLDLWLPFAPLPPNELVPFPLFPGSRPGRRGRVF